MRGTYHTLKAALWILLFLCGALHVEAYTYDFYYGGIYYDIIGENSVRVTHGTNNYVNDVVIPSTVTYNNLTYTVTEVNEWAFKECTRLLTVTIPATVTTIGELAFADCYRLTDAVLPSTLFEIGDGAFQNCRALTNITLPASLTRINPATFSNCLSLKSVTIPEAVTHIGDYAFSYCDSLADLTIGNSVKVIGNGAFTMCNALTSIELPASVESINEWAFDQCSQLENVTVPESVRHIGIGAFDNTPWLERQPNGMVMLGTMLYKFKGDMPAGTDLSLENGLEGIAGGAFHGCNGLASISLPESINRINPHAFTQCESLKSVTCLSLTPPILENSQCFDSTCYTRATLQMPHVAVKDYQNSEYWRLFKDIEGIDYSFFADSSNYMMTSENTVTIIYKDENYYTYEGDVVIPATVMLGDMEFTVTAIGDNAFEGCENMTSIAMPTTITAIGNNAFDACCGLTVLSIPSSVQTIGSQAFQGCTGLRKVIIEGALASLGSRAFFYCNALDTVTCLSEIPPVMESSNCFTMTGYANALLQVPNKAIEAYKSADYWRRFATIKGLIEVLKGDVNGDGDVTIKDMTAIVDYLLGDYDGPFVEENADLNGDNEVTIKDMTLLIDYLLNN